MTTELHAHIWVGTETQDIQHELDLKPTGEYADGSEDDHIQFGAEIPGTDQYIELRIPLRALKEEYLQEIYATWEAAGQ